jgi:two-component system phosphate regulon response regulator PhoB
MTTDDTAGVPGEPTRVAGAPGHNAALTPTERRLLEVLRALPGRAFTRAELIALVMPDAVVLERTIDVHVKALRRKLGPGEGRIETVRRVGYRFVPASEDRPPT